MKTNAFILRLALVVFASAVSAAYAQSQLAGDYPTKPVRLVTAAPGGGNDFAARVFARGLAGPLGQPVIVENRGSGEIAAEIVSKSRPDGYSLLVIGSDFWIRKLLGRVPWDPIKDFSPISFATSAPNILVVHPSTPVKSVKDLIDLAKAKPGELNYASSSPGSAAHLAGELLKSLAGVNMVHIAYKGQGAANTAMLSGEVQLMFAAPSLVTPLVKAGRLRALAVTSAKPTALAPGLPTVAATVPGFQAASAILVLAPAGTPAAIINRLNQELVRLLNQPEVKENYLNLGVEVVASSPQELAATIKFEEARWGKVIKDAGIRED